MSKLRFSGRRHEILLFDRHGRLVGEWPAYNHVDSHASVQPHLPDGTYVVQDTTRPHFHPANPNGPYGSYGIIRFTVPGHIGVGLHSGRADATHLPGPQHPTMGCIRTADAAMRSIRDFMAADPLTTVQVTWSVRQPAGVAYAAKEKLRAHR